MLNRLYEPVAYDVTTSAPSYWEATTTRDPYPVFDTDTEAEVAIVGAGYTGLSAALHLARDQGAAPVVLDAGYPGWGASGRNGGFCCLGGSSLERSGLIRRFGQDQTDQFLKLEADAVSLVGGLLDHHGIDADVQPGGEICIAHRASEVAHLADDLAATKQVLGGEHRMLSAADLTDQGLQSTNMHGASVTEIGFGLHPLKYAQGLARAAVTAGVRIFGQSAVTQINRLSDGRFELRTANSKLIARKLIIATNGYSSDNLPGWMRGRYLPVLSNIIVTRPLTGTELQAQGWTSRIMAYDSRHLIHYFRLLPDNRMLFGMRGNARVTPRTQAQTLQYMKRDFAAMFPKWADVEHEFYWSGLLCLSARQVPYIGPIPGWAGAFTGLAYHGNGVAMGSMAGKVLADQVAGEVGVAIPDFITQIPSKFPLGPLRRAILPAAFTLFGLKDRF